MLDLPQVRFPAAPCDSFLRWLAVWRGRHRVRMLPPNTRSFAKATRRRFARLVLCTFHMREGTRPLVRRHYSPFRGGAASGLTLQLYSFFFSFFLLLGCSGPRPTALLCEKQRRGTGVLQMMAREDKNSSLLKRAGYVAASFAVLLSLMMPAYIAPHAVNAQTPQAVINPTHIASCLAQHLPNTLPSFFHPPRRCPRRRKRRRRP